MRAVLYARYSSDLQNAASIDDQERICRQRAEREGWLVVEMFSDHAISGSTMLRPGYQALLARLRQGGIGIVLAESLDRISRDQEHIAAFYKQASFGGARIITLAEGEIGDLHIGLKGAMGAIYLKDLAAKTHRGLAGRIEKGRSIGAPAYGYRVVRRLKADGEPDRGLREINPDQALIVRRIFADYLAGKSPRAIARALNQEGIPGPTGGIWYDTAIRGRAARHDGLLRNSLYVGRLVWNRLASAKNPIDGQRVRRANAADALVEHEVPELAIVEPIVWHAAQERLAREAAPPVAEETDAPADSPTSGPFWERRRARHLLSGKVVCGLCGSRFHPVGKHYLACRAGSLRACTNPARPSRPALEAQVAAALAHRLMDPVLTAEFSAAFTQSWRQLTAEAEGHHEHHRRELQQVERKIANLVDALADGLRTPDIRQRLADLESRRSELLEASKAPPSVVPLMPPNLAEVYRARLATLQRELAGPDNSEAREAARALIDKVVVTPGGTRTDPDVELVGNLAGMLRIGGLTTRTKESSALAEQVLGMFQSSVKGEPGALPLDPSKGGAFANRPFRRCSTRHFQKSPPPGGARNQFSTRHLQKSPPPGGARNQFSTRHFQKSPPPGGARNQFSTRHFQKSPPSRVMKFDSTIRCTSLAPSTSRACRA